MTERENSPSNSTNTINSSIHSSKSASLQQQTGKIHLEHIPVIGCELTPTYTLPSSDPPIEPVFSWYKTAPLICSYPSCSLPAKIQCLLCSDSQPTLDPSSNSDSIFCSNLHYNLSRETHHQTHHKNHPTPTPSIYSQFEHTFSPPSPNSLPSTSSALTTFLPTITNLTYSLISTSTTTSNYTPKNSDIGCMLLFTVSPLLTPNSPILQYKTQPVLPRPPLPKKRKLIGIKSNSLNPKENGLNKISIMTYNILSQRLANTTNYSHCPSWALQWSYRKDLLIYEMLYYSPDIICLQEVPHEYFTQFFLPVLSAKGDYDGIFQSKKKRQEGSAIFFKKGKYIMLQKNVVDLSESAKIWVGGAHTDLNRKKLKRLIHGNICLVALLEEIPVLNTSNKRRFIVASPHMFWDPKFPDVKLWQCISIIKYLEKFYFNDGLGLIIAGDFNSGIYSTAYEFLSSGKVVAGHTDFGYDRIGILPRVDEIRHNLPLASGYSIVGEPSFSNFTVNFVDLIDYIWFTQTNFHVLGVLDVYKKKDMKEYTALPSPKHPSDHIPLMITLGWNT